MVEMRLGSNGADGRRGEPGLTFMSEEQQSGVKRVQWAGQEVVVVQHKVPNK